MTDIDSARLVYELLSGDATLVAAITNVVETVSVLDLYGPPGMPVDFLIRPAIVFWGDGGPSDRIFGRESFDFYCYGNDSAQARSLFATLRTLLDRRKHSTITVGSEQWVFQYAELMSGPQDRVEPEEGWPFIYCSFMIHFVRRPLP